MGSRSNIVLAICLVGAVIAGSVGGITFARGFQGASAGTTDSLAQVTFGGQTFWNYDFSSKKPTFHHVDFPVMLVFTRNATIQKVQRILSKFRYVGAAVYQQIGTADVVAWQANNGRKTNPCKSIAPGGIPFDYHLRFYGNKYNKVLGHWVIATVHQDRYDCGSGQPDRAYGWNEEAESYITKVFRKHGYKVVPNNPVFRFDNAMNLWEGNNYYRSNGRASQIIIP